MAANCVVFQWRSQQDFEAVFQAGVLYSYAMMFKACVLQKLTNININDFDLNRSFSGRDFDKQTQCFTHPVCIP
jgi:hypothetical protein